MDGMYLHIDCMVLALSLCWTVSLPIAQSSENGSSLSQHSSIGVNGKKQEIQEQYNLVFVFDAHTVVL